ncbi:hypothetical protein JCM11641_003646 [Rhodosporidiobolus odoratus]
MLAFSFPLLPLALLLNSALRVKARPLLSASVELGKLADVNANNTPTPGEEGAWGVFEYGVNSIEEVICYNITLYISGNYSSPANTATHIHQAGVGRNGPPRIAFPNPTPLNWTEGDSTEWLNSTEKQVRRSLGCLKGPFTTGILANGTDTGTNFTLSTLEASPSSFFTDSHTARFPAGAIRGQLKDGHSKHN